MIDIMQIESLPPFSHIELKLWLSLRYEGTFHQLIIYPKDATPTNYLTAWLNHLNGR